MAGENNLKNGDSTINFEDEEMVQFKKCAVNVVTFRIVVTEDDLETSNKKKNSFKPDMAHQIFGETEMIFGYRHLSINLYYLHNSAKCCVEVQFSDKIAESEGCKADDIMKALNSWLPANYQTNKEEFKRELALENHEVMFGEVINTFQDDTGSSFKVTLCDMNDEDFKDFHQRFETFIVWFIDGANYIDLEDTRWSIFYIYQEFVNSSTNQLYRSPIGFCTVYKFFLYPNLTRPRISQFFVLPTHQKRGLGTKFYSTVYNYLRQLPDSGDITVEEPTEIFQRIRDYSDSLHVYKDLEENQINISTENQKKISEYLRKHKICKRQAQRVFDILECLTSHKNGYEEYVKFTNSIKARIANEVEKETRGSKRLCNLDRSAVSVDHLDKKTMIEAEYNRYIDSLEWPTNRLRAYLAKN